MTLTEEADEAGRTIMRTKSAAQDVAGIKDFYDSREVFLEDALVLFQRSPRPSLNSPPVSVFDAIYTLFSLCSAYENSHSYTARSFSIPFSGLTGFSTHS